MEDDDEFGDLYADVLRPVSTTSEAPPPPTPPPRSENNDDDGLGRVLVGVPSDGFPSPLPSQLPAQSVFPDAREGGDEDRIHSQAPVTEEQALGWSEGEDEGSPRVSSGRAAGSLPQQGGVCGLLVEEEEVVAAGLVEAPHKEVAEEEEGVGIAEDVGAFVQGREAVVRPDVDVQNASLDQELAIPGLSVACVPSGALDGTGSGDTKVSTSDDWDSDSEDELQIVLNDENLGLDSGNTNAAPRVEDDDDEDGEDDLVIVTEEEQEHPHPHPVQEMKEQDWDEESAHQPLDGEKEKSELTRGNGDMDTVAPVKIGYSSHGYYGQHHSQFKYIRPGVAAIPGGAVAGTGADLGQLRPPLTMGPMTGRGRGTQKSFHSGYGLIVWSNGTLGRAYSAGLEFTLPSHKTIFEIDIDGFEKKPWRLPGVDISDFFNFGLNEDRWRVFCKQLEQLRVEATMQSKICVYESGRSEQEYDPDLPPELAAATALYGISAESVHHGKVDREQADLSGQGRVLCLRPQLPVGRAIQVESSFGERLPSIDTRPPRMRDSDVIIEVVLQDSVDVCSGALDEQPYEPQGQDVEGGHEDEDDDKHFVSELVRHFQPACSGGKRGVKKTKEFPNPMDSIDNNVPEGNNVLPFPPDASSKCLPSSKPPAPAIDDNHYVASQAARHTQSITRAECSNDSISSQSVKLQIYDGQKKRSADRMEDEGILQILPVASLETAVEVKVGQRNDEHSDLLSLDDDVELEKEETASDLQLSGECHGDNYPCHAVKKQKLSSQVERLAFQDRDNRDDSRATHSDNSRAQSGSSMDHPKRRKGSEEEVMQGGRTRQIRDLTGHHLEKKQSSRQRDDYGHDGGHDINRSHATSKEKEDMHQSHLHTEWDSTRSEAFESRKERDYSFGGFLRREDGALGIKGKVDGGKRGHDDEIGSRNRSKVIVSQMEGKHLDLPSRKHIGDGDWKGHHDRDGAPRQKERNAISMGKASRHENFDDLHVKRNMDEGQPRREKVAKKDVLHMRKGMECTTLGKREKDNGANNRSREDQTSVRDKVENHFIEHGDDNLRHREREDRQKLNEDMHTHKRREEGHTIVRSGRLLNNKSISGVERVNSVSRDLDLDGYPPKDRRPHGERNKRGDHVKEYAHSQHKAQQKLYPHEKRSTKRGKASKTERFNSHSDHTLATSDSQHVYRERHRENSKKNKESKGVGRSCLTSGKRKREDQKHHLKEKINANGANDQGCSSTFSGQLLKKGHHHIDKHNVQEQHHFSGNHAEEDVSSDDDSNRNVSRGRSKLERWTSSKERDYGRSSLQPLSSSSRARESAVNNVEIIQGVAIKTEDMGVDSDVKHAVVVQVVHGEDGGDRLLDTVAKPKRQSDCLHLEHTMPGEDTTMIEKPENEAPLIQSGASADREIKQGQPARKRRWTSR